MLDTRALVFTLCLVPFSLLPAWASTRQAGARSHAPLVRFSLVNLSGKAREAHIHGSTIALPVAKPVAVQVPAGTDFKIASNTDDHVCRVIRVSRAEEGRLVSVQ